MTKTLELNFHPDGTVTTEAHGFQGQSCAAALKTFHDALGTVATSKKKLEFHQIAAKGQTYQNQNT